MARKKSYRCPCCGQAMPKPGVKPDVHLGVMQQALFNIVKKCPNGITTEHIRERLLATTHRDDNYSHNIVAVMARHINKKIAPWGLRIKGTGGPGSVYRLIQL